MIVSSWLQVDDSQAPPNRLNMKLENVTSKACFVKKKKAPNVIIPQKMPVDRHIGVIYEVAHAMAWTTAGVLLYTWISFHKIECKRLSISLSPGLPFIFVKSTCAKVYRRQLLKPI